MFSENDELIILASWLHNEHLEDVDVIPVGNFTDEYWDMAKTIKQYGADLKRIYERLSPSFVSKVLREYSPELYGWAIESAMQEEMHKGIPQDASPTELAEYVRRFTRSWQERPKSTDLVASYLDELGERSKMKQINTGIAVVDRLTYGIHKGQLTVVGARPSVGKSAFTLQVAFDVARKGHKVIFLPLEMTANEITDRLVMRFGNGVSNKALRSGILDVDQMNAVNDVLEAIDGMKNFQIIEKVRDLDLIRQVIHDEKPDLVVIDQLSQIKVENDRLQIRERFVEVTRSLKAIALEEDVPIWLPCQVNRGGKESDRITMEHLKESGSIEEDADIVILLSNVQNSNGDYTDVNGNRYVLVDVAKNRQGGLGDEVVAFDCPRFWFKNRLEGFIPTSNEEEF